MLTDLRLQDEIGQRLCRPVVHLPGKAQALRFLRFDDVDDQIIAGLTPARPVFCVEGTMPPSAKPVICSHSSMRAVRCFLSLWSFSS